MRICVIFNPAARGNRARYFRRHLEDIGVESALKPTTAPGGGRLLAAEAVREGFDTIVAAGGDGTVNEVVNGIADEPSGLARARLGVLPLGTINVFARELRLPLAMRHAWEVVCRGREKAIDLAQAQFVSDGQTVKRHFVQLAGAGLDALAVELVDWDMKKRVGFWAYALAALRALKRPRSTISVAGMPESGELVLLGNGRYYGGPLAAFPRADLSDGLLDLCLYPRVNLGTVLSVLGGLATGRLSRAGGVRHRQAETFTLTAPARTPLQLDGEAAGELPCTFSIRRLGLRVIVP